MKVHWTAYLPEVGEAIKDEASTILALDNKIAALISMRRGMEMALRGKVRQQWTHAEIVEAMRLANRKE